MLLFIAIVFNVIALTDLIYLKGEEMYWRLGAYNKTASTLTGYGEFGLFYALIGVALAYSNLTWTDRGIILGVIIFLHVCGVEDFLFYLYEPLIPAWDRENGKQAEFLFWRFPKELYWLETSPILKLVCGKGIPLKRFLVFVLSVIGLTIIFL
jgi:hypothetical protein